MCISGALGGILGGVMEMGQVHGVLTGIQEGMQFFLNSVRTWMLPLMAICGVIALVLHMFFDTGILAIVMPSVIWLVTSVTYCRVCLQNKGEKLSK